MRIERLRRPQKCPICGGRPVATIFYGLPGCVEDLEQKLDAGELVIGGCVSDPYFDPQWHCTHCETDIFRRLPKNL